MRIISVYIRAWWQDPHRRSMGISWNFRTPVHYCICFLRQVLGGPKNGLVNGRYLQFSGNGHWKLIKGWCRSSIAPSVRIHRVSWTSLCALFPRQKHGSGWYPLTLESGWKIPVFNRKINCKWWSIDKHGVSSGCSKSWYRYCQPQPFRFLQVFRVRSFQQAERSSILCSNDNRFQDVNLSKKSSLYQMLFFY